MVISSYYDLDGRFWTAEMYYIGIFGVQNLMLRSQMLNSQHVNQQNTENDPYENNLFNIHPTRRIVDLFNSFKQYLNGFSYDFPKKIVELSQETHRKFIRKPTKYPPTLPQTLPKMPLQISRKNSPNRLLIEQGASRNALGIPLGNSQRKFTLLYEISWEMSYDVFQMNFPKEI